MKYPKIQTLFKRDTHNKIIVGDYSNPEFLYLENNIFECTEKVDGTNIRVEITPNELHPIMEFKGRTDNADIPVELLSKLNTLFPYNKIINYFESKGPITTPITIYGEGYGRKIQKGERYISNGVNFILFDVKVGHLWLKRESLEVIAKALNLDIVPLVGYYTIKDAIEVVKNGFKSRISEDKELLAEGLILKTPLGLNDRQNNRIITKLKTCDFK